jgi:hypothetical protein
VTANSASAEAGVESAVSHLSLDDSTKGVASEVKSESNLVPAISLELMFIDQDWELGPWKAPLHVVKSRSGGVELLNLVLSYLTDAGLTLLQYEVNEEEYLPPCEPAIYDAAKSNKALGDDDCRPLREALYVQNANWVKTRQWWDQISTHCQ